MSEIATKVAAISELKAAISEYRVKGGGEEIVVTDRRTRDSLRFMNRT